jgi:hypothetical protein
MSDGVTECNRELREYDDFKITGARITKKYDKNGNPKFGLLVDVTINVGGMDGSETSKERAD